MKLTCPHCRTDNEYERHEIGPHGETRCHACRRAFSDTASMRNVGAAVAPAPPSPSLAPMYTAHSHEMVEASRARLYEYVARHPDQMDHDRDVLLLAMFDRIDMIHRRGR